MRSKFCRALLCVWQSAPGWTLGSAVLLIAQGALPLVSLYLMKLVVDAIAAGMTAPDQAVAFGRVGLLVALSGGAALAAAACGAVARLVNEAQAEAVTDHMHGVLQAQSVAVDLAYYENSRYYDTLHRAQREAPYRPTRIVGALAQLGQSGVSLLGIAALLFTFHWSIAFLLVLAAVPGVLARVRSARRAYAWQRDRTEAERQTWYLNCLLTRDEYAREMRLFGLGDLFMRRFDALRRQLRGEKLGLATRRAAVELLAGSLETGAVFALYGFVGYRAVLGHLTVGDLVLYYQAMLRAQSCIGQVLSSLGELYESNLFLTNLYEFLDLKPAVVEPRHPRQVPRPVRAGLVFDHVSFCYPGSERMALGEVTLTIRPGEHVAFVGANGAGKTTLIKLLSRLYDPTAGAIALDGIDLREFAPAALRREIGAVLQDFARYQLTAEENIWLGSVEQTPDREQIVAAARDAGAHDIIARLKEGYDTPLGRWFGNGAELSVGEWQKVALARAFHRDAQILILDEPTSAMDPEAEYELFQKFHQLAAGRTAILISHRLSTVRMADRIYVLDGGRIVEWGTHDDLVDRGGCYARLFETQAQCYR